MRRSLLTILADDPRFDVDSRAHLRETVLPKMTMVLRVSNWEAAMVFAPQRSPSPAVIIKEDGRALIFNSGGTGIVWICAESEMNEAQSETLGVVLNALQSLTAVLSLSTPFELVE